jgi:hypothetical protein
VKEDHYVLDVGAHGGSTAEQEGFRQLQASQKTLFSPNNTKKRIVPCHSNWVM